MKLHSRIERARKSNRAVHAGVYVGVCSRRKHITQLWVLYMVMLPGLIGHGRKSVGSRSNNVVRYSSAPLTENLRVKGGATA